MATCEPTLFLLTVKEILLAHFIITNFRLHTKCCVHLGYEILCRKRPRRQFFSRFVKVRFRSLDIQITIVQESDSNNILYLIPWDKWHLSHSFEWNKELHYRAHFITPLSGISELHYPTQWDK
jgi:hypothetical protein